MRLHSILGVMTVASLEAIARGAASPRCLSMTSPLALRHLHLLVVMLTSLVAPVPNPKCKRPCSVVPASPEVTRTTQTSLLTIKAFRTLTTITMLAPDIE